MTKNYAGDVIENAAHSFYPDEDQDASLTKEGPGADKTGSSGVEHDVLRRDDIEEEDARTERDAELNDARR